MRIAGLAWGGRFLTLAQPVLKHGSATVSFETYQPILERAKGVLNVNYFGLFRTFGEANN